MFVLLDDTELRDYNFSLIWDPDLLAGHGPKETDLYRLVHESRHGRPTGTEFASAMYWTLRPATFEAFQRNHGSRPIEYRDWFYSKLYQFLTVLVYEAVEVYGLGPETGLEKLRADEPWRKGCRVLRGEGPFLFAEEVEASFTPEDNESEEGTWGEIVERLAGTSENRFAVLQDWMRERRVRRSAAPRRRRRWAKNQERDEVILSCLARGMERRQVCVELDRRAIATLPIIQNTKSSNGWKSGMIPTFRRTFSSSCLNSGRAKKLSSHQQFPRSCRIPLDSALDL